ncbi:putative mitochondrial protein [Phytophthora megakarya]|uniref:Putative mitochondrial protein n=1 Tax=Phytophthora megakarya TaxID=4795 RepID=A0A225WYW5_9STRA|nr:putative mitochondrial protein [Phytophthora megakarya]
MLRLWRGSRPLAALARGFSVVPAQPTVDAAAKASSQSIYSQRIGPKWQKHGFRDTFPTEGFDRALQFLMGRGISHTKALRAISYHILIVSLSPELMQSKITWLSKFGLSDEKINSIIVRAPSILGISLDKYEALVDWYLSHGVAKERQPYLFYVFPQGVSYSIKDNLDPKMTLLKDIGCDDGQITRILTTSAFIFRLSVDRMASNVEFLAKLGIPREQIPAVLAIAPQYLALTPTRIQEAVDMLDEMFGEGVGVRTMMKSRVLLFNVDGLRKSFDYLVSTVGLTPARLAKQVQLIGRSVDGILRPRVEFFKMIGVNDKEIRDNVKWVSISNREFFTRYPAYKAYLAEYKAHQKEIAHQA